MNESKNQKQHADSGLAGVIAELGRITKDVAMTAASPILSPISRVGSIFSRENLVNAALPKYLANPVNAAFNLMRSETSEIAPEPTRTAQNQRSEPDAAEDESDDLEGLEAVLEDGFEELSEKLDVISAQLDGADLSELQQAIDDIEIPDSIDLAAELENDIQLLNGNEELIHLSQENEDNAVELLSINGQILKKLDDIERNTRVDELAAREAELEANKGRSSQIAQDLIQASENKKEEKGKGLVEGLLENLPKLGIGALGLKVAKGKINAPKVPSAVKPNILTRALSKTPIGKVLGLGTAATKAFPTIIPSMADDVAGAATKAISTAPKTGMLQSLKGGAGKLLGAPLSVGLGALEVMDVASNQELKQEEKTVEYSKIGGKTAGALAGAKAGAAVGAALGPAGAVVGSLIGGIGGFFLGEQGGEVVGNLINSVFPSSDPVEVKAISEDGTAKVEAIQSKVAENIATELTTKVASVDIGSKYGDMQGGERKAEFLNTLSNHIEATTAERETAKLSPIIAPITINNNQTNQGQSSQERTRIGIPAVRNQDGTIQRLLDANYRPLIA